MNVNIMQVLGNYVFTYRDQEDSKTFKNVKRPILVDATGHAPDRVLSGISKLDGEFGPARKLDDEKLWRTDGNRVEVIDLNTCQIVDEVSLNSTLDYFAQKDKDILVGVSRIAFLTKDSRQEKIMQDVIKKEHGIELKNSSPVQDSEFVAYLCKHKGVLKLAWFLHDEKNRTVSRINVNLILLPCNYFDCVSDFQTKRSGNHVLVAVTGYKSSSNDGVANGKDMEDPNAAFIAVMLYELTSPYPTLIANLKCVPPVGVKKCGAPREAYAICPKKDAPGVFTISATWSGSDKNLVNWTIDANNSTSFKKSMVNEVIGVHSEVNSSEGLYFDKTVSVMASSVDPYSYSGFFKSPEGVEQVFYLREESSVVKTWEDSPSPPPKELYRLIENLRLEDDDDDDEVQVTGIIPTFNLYKYFVR